jgi:hypothetical protein
MPTSRLSASSPARAFAADAAFELDDSSPVAARGTR